MMIPDMRLQTELSRQSGTYKSGHKTSFDTVYVCRMFLF